MAELVNKNSFETMETQTQSTKDYKQIREHKAIEFMKELSFDLLPQEIQEKILFAYKIGFCDGYEEHLNATLVNLKKLA